MRIKAIIFGMILSLAFASLYAQEAKQDEVLAKAGYNSSKENLEKVQAMENVLGFFACVGCHNSKETYSLIVKQGEVFKLKYYSSAKSQLSEDKREFDLNSEEARGLLAIIEAEIAKAKEVSGHTQGAKQGSSFEFGVKNDDAWAVAGYYSKGAYSAIKDIAMLLRAKTQEEMLSKMNKVLLK